ncbi:RNA polymerase sigma factor [Actinoplanes sp. NPDC023801]|uniref:RNA polymerase sigma factor n=1 Tax=Actinoplanes sp. NPDC023801 TaxID=3154595 RepID=UPI0033CD2DC8
MSALDGSAALASEPGDGEESQQAESVRLKKEHDAEFGVFFNQSYHSAERVLRARCWDPEMLRDALQEAYLEGRVQWAKIREYREPIASIITTARYKILKEQDRRQREAAPLPDEVPVGPQSDLADAWEAEELLRGWLQQLPPRHAEVFQMSREGFSNQEIARALGLTDNSVRSYKVAARQQLRQLAERAGYTDAKSRRTGGAHGPR